MENQQAVVTGTPPVVTEGLDNKLDLRKKARPHEMLIQGFLFFSGAVSILTSIAIVIVLGNEALLFFQTPTWAEVRDETDAIVSLSAEITEDTTSLPLAENKGQFLKAGQKIRLDNEIMQIVAVEGDVLTVERGLEDTTKVAHQPQTHIRLEGDNISLVEFLTGTSWQPHIGEFGVLALVSATLTISFIAMFVALPLGVGVAIYLSEYASEGSRNKIKPILEILAGVPTVVYGYFALTFITPILQGILGKETLGIYNMLSAGIVMGIMILPTVASMSEDALRAVPRALREASYGLGSTKLETSTKVVLPAGISGVVAAFILGMSRAVGETMIVAIAAGARPFFSFNPFEAAETMTGHIARISTGDLPRTTIDYNSLFAIGLTLFLVTLVLNIISRQVSTWLREEYD